MEVRVQGVGTVLWGGGRVVMVVVVVALSWRKGCGQMRFPSEWEKPVSASLAAAAPAPLGVEPPGRPQNQLAGHALQ